MFDKNVEMVLLRAAREAQERAHEYLVLEHLLLAILENEEGAEVLENCGADIDELRKQIGRFLDTNIETFLNRGGVQPQQTLAFQRVLQRAILHVKYSSKDAVGVGDLLAAIFT
ncbi:MAG: hypothetical protein KDD44_04765, partial [Bdellovibrionales bacterium]|nr:hypothetical protein [Bdellovibrionales bacterium]